MLLWKPAAGLPRRGHRDTAGLCGDRSWASHSSAVWTAYWRSPPSACRKHVSASWIIRMRYIICTSLRQLYTTDPMLSTELNCTPTCTNIILWCFKILVGLRLWLTWRREPCSRRFHNTSIPINRSLWKKTLKHVHTWYRPQAGLTHCCPGSK